MNKYLKRKIVFMTVQFVAAVGILLSIAGLVLNSYIEVRSIDGIKTYKIFPIQKDEDFEDSEIYLDLFKSALSDITQLVAIKGQMETDGRIDVSKHIDVSDYAKQTGYDNDSRLTATYELDDLIKWGKYGITYKTYTFSITDFVSYFGYVVYPENFTLDEYEQLVVDGFYRVGEEALATGEFEYDLEGQILPGSTQAYYGKSIEDVSVIYERMEDSGISESEFEEMIFSYIMSLNLDGIELLEDETGRRKVQVSIINNRYDRVDSEVSVLKEANNWIDYFKFQKNLEIAISTVGVNYSRYQLCNKAYQPENTNVKYMIRAMDSNGTVTYTNVPKYQDKSDEEVTEMFSEYRRYLIYYPDSLSFMGNTVLSEDDLYSTLRAYEYGYPDTSHIWIGVDTSYEVKGDSFYNAYTLYQRIVPNIWKIVTLLISLTLLWIVMGVLMTVYSGVSIDSAGQKKRYLRRFDGVYTEILILFTAFFGFIGYRGYLYLEKLAEISGASVDEVLGVSVSRISEYALFALLGIYLNTVLNIVWFSVVRRYKNHVLWSGSLLFRFGKWLGRFGSFVFQHSNSVIGKLIGYNVFVFTNFFAFFALYHYREERLYFVLIFAGIMIIDGIVGAILCKESAEQRKIVEGINRIRSGEVDYSLNLDNLHGVNRELAEAVNNIGEGIKKAVKTSMKDEQMKTDLITNVSHDIKTPLTSIINYVDLLKRLKITEEPAKGYIQILDNKSRRLKQLTDDLVEASKISSGNIELHCEKLNFAELVKQGIGEFSEKLEENGLEVVYENQAGGAAYIFADSRRMWRVVENLLNNICKYSLENTRVYIDLLREEGRIICSFKNISRQQMNINPQELTERFIRGDSARSTEGSGLGLSIAQNLTKAQNGEFVIYLDGDLFKISLSFPEFVDEKAQLHEEQISDDEPKLAIEVKKNRRNKKRNRG